MIGEQIYHLVKNGFNVSINMNSAPNLEGVRMTLTAERKANGPINAKVARSAARIDRRVMVNEDYMAIEYALESRLVTLLKETNTI